MGTEIINDVKKWFENTITADFLNQHYNDYLHEDGFDEDKTKSDLTNVLENILHCSKEEINDSLKLKFLDAEFLEPSYYDFKIRFEGSELYLEGRVKVKQTYFAERVREKEDEEDVDTEDEVDADEADIYDDIDYGYADEQLGENETTITIENFTLEFPLGEFRRRMTF